MTRKRLLFFTYRPTVYRVSEADRLRPAGAVDLVQHCQQQRRRRHDLILVFHHHLR